MGRHMQPVHLDLANEISALCEGVNMSVSAFGLNAVNDPNFYHDILAGRECRQKTLRAVREYMDELRKTAA